MKHQFDSFQVFRIWAPIIYALDQGNSHGPNIGAIRVMLPLNSLGLMKSTCQHPFQTKRIATYCSVRNERQKRVANLVHRFARWNKFTQLDDAFRRKQDIAGFNIPVEYLHTMQVGKPF